MKINIISILILGTVSLFGFCLANIEGNSKIRQTHFLATRAVQSTAPKLKLFRRARPWTRKEEELLLALREQKLPWAKIHEILPERSWKALTDKYYQLTADPPTKKKRPTERKIWTTEERDLC